MNFPFPVVLWYGSQTPNFSIPFMRAKRFAANTALASPFAASVQDEGAHVNLCVCVCVCVCVCLGVGGVPHQLYGGGRVRVRDLRDEAKNKNPHAQV